MQQLSIAFIKLTVALILLNNHMFMNGENIFRLQCDRIDDIISRIPENEQVILKAMIYRERKDSLKYIHVDSNHKVIDVSEEDIAHWNTFDAKQLSTFSVFTMTEIDARYYLSNAKGYSTQEDFQILCRGKDGMPTDTIIMESSKDPMPHHCLWSGRDNGGLSFIPLRAFALREASEGLEKVYDVSPTLPLDSKQKFIFVKTESGSWIVSSFEYASALISNLWQLNFLWVQNDWEYWATSDQKDEKYNVAANKKMLCNQRSRNQYYIEVKPDTENENLRPQNVNDCCVWIRNFQTGLFFISSKCKE